MPYVYGAHLGQGRGEDVVWQSVDLVCDVVVEHGVRPFALGDLALMPGRMAVR
ncbi:hypothetical protein [Mycolicibacterium sp. GF69]|uniref:hypothetical protein n=1 Tax=Mycolicibacterium sp. GF69 TaxID=2267251 RepID=UPI0014025D86|nr:hypothetical protein [Mycolicibacterium sp. GF69]